MVIRRIFSYPAIKHLSWHFLCKKRIHLVTENHHLIGDKVDGILLCAYCDNRIHLQVIRWLHRRQDRNPGNQFRHFGIVFILLVHPFPDTDQIAVNFLHGLGIGQLFLQLAQNIFLCLSHFNRILIFIPVIRLVKRIETSGQNLLPALCRNRLRRSLYVFSFGWYGSKQTEYSVPVIHKIFIRLLHGRVSLIIICGSRKNFFHHGKDFFYLFGIIKLRTDLFNCFVIIYTGWIRTQKCLRLIIEKVINIPRQYCFLILRDIRQFLFCHIPSDSNQLINPLCNRRPFQSSLIILPLDGIAFRICILIKSFS